MKELYCFLNNIIFLDTYKHILRDPAIYNLVYTYIKHIANWSYFYMLLYKNVHSLHSESYMDVRLKNIIRIFS